MPSSPPIILRQRSRSEDLSSSSTDDDFATRLPLTASSSFHGRLRSMTTGQADDLFGADRQQQGLRLLHRHSTNTMSSYHPNMQRRENPFPNHHSWSNLHQQPPTRTRSNNTVNNSNNSHVQQDQLLLKPCETRSDSDSERSETKNNHHTTTLITNSSLHQIQLALPARARVIQQRDQLVVVSSPELLLRDKFDDDDDDENDSPNATNNNNNINSTPTASTLLRQEYGALIHVLDPPMSCGELLRDRLLRFLDLPIFQVVGLVVVLLVVMDGAFFAFLLVGWHGLCHEPSTRDCEPRNGWYNWAIQVLMVLISYINAMSFPWRMTNFLHLTGWSCPARHSTTQGCSLYGVPDDPDLWFHIPWRKRLGITCLLLLNNVLQFTNHAMRLHYNTYALQGAWPGNLLTSVFLVGSFSCAGAGGIWMLYEMGRLRQGNPEKFGPGPAEIVSKKVHKYLRRRHTKRRKHHKGHHRHRPSSATSIPKEGFPSDRERSSASFSSQAPPESTPCHVDNRTSKHSDEDEYGVGSCEDDVESPTTMRPQQSEFQDESQGSSDSSSSSEEQVDHSHSYATDLQRRREHPDPTRDALRRAVVGEGTERAGFRMFAM